MLTKEKWVRRVPIMHANGYEHIITGGYDVFSSVLTAKLTFFLIFLHVNSHSQ